MGRMMSFVTLVLSEWTASGLDITFEIEPFVMLAMSERMFLPFLFFFDGLDLQL